MKTYKVEYLESLVSVSTVLAFRDKVPNPVDDGNAYALSSRDLVSSWPQPLSWLTKINISSEQKKEALIDGDILMPARGNYYPARYFFGCEKDVLPIGQVFVIRPYEKSMGRFLAWYLNRHEVQVTIHSLISGTTVQSLKKSMLTSLQIFLPSKYTQERIGKINALEERRLILQAQLSKIQKDEIEAACRHIFEGKND